MIAAGTAAALAGMFKGGIAVAAADKGGLIDAALNCVKAGEICQQHCLELLGQGDKSMAECSKTVTEMLSFCRTLAELAAHKSDHLPKFAGLCADVCKNCEKACRVHEGHHVQCKNCAETCARCAAECAKVA
jgi:Cys-rich four helix bundle protein (predicted Tat secretion target)